MRWDDYYEKINYWAISTAVNKISSLEDMGSPDEITDALNIIALDDEKGATRLLNKALQFGVKFSGENLSQIVDLCSEESFKKALYQSADAFTSQDLKDLYCCIDDELIIDVAKKQNLKLPVDLQDEVEYDDVDDLRFEIDSAIDAAEYALQCLIQAQSALNNSSNVSFLDMMSKGFFTSLWKYSSLSEADVEMQNAQNALNHLNATLRNLSRSKSVGLKYGRLASVIDMWFDSGFMDAFVHLQINKAQKQIHKAITKVESIIRELVRL